eukprot:TRINITY_DN6742_c0_g3_i2.p1 TRINITY_DN6742_c0_g3~~TRINITY_DN6742_c0_g3_i2.p1  ORF type:complete len:550 (+),score=171.53 TRINITY_DN6742_c0_g3_i2:62-1651(+)
MCIRDSWNMNPGNDDVFEGLNEEQKGKALEFCTITGTEDVNVAANFLSMSNFDVAKSVQLFFDLGPNAVQSRAPTNNARPQPPTRIEEEFPQHYSPPLTHSNSNQFIPPEMMYGGDFLPPMMGGPTFQRSVSQETPLHHEYREFLIRKQHEDIEFNPIKDLAKGTLGLIKRVFSYPPGGERFIGALKKAKVAPNTIQFRKGKFVEVIEASWTERKPLLIFIVPEETSEWSPFLQIMNNKEISTYIAKSFVVLGLLNDRADLEGIPIDVGRLPVPSVFVFRRNIIEEPLVLDQFSIAEAITDVGLPGIKTRLQNVINDYFFVYAEEDKVRQDVNRQMQAQFRPAPLFPGGIFGGDAWANEYQPRPPPRQIDPVEQERLNQDRILRSQQESSYNEMIEKARLEEERRKQAEETKRREEEIFLQQQREKEEQRKKRESQIPQEPSESDPNAILILFRTPGGEKIIRRFNPEDKVQHIYYFLESRKETAELRQTGFEVIQTHPFKSYQDTDETSLNDAFDGSKQETLHLRERS